MSKKNLNFFIEFNFKKICFSLFDDDNHLSYFAVKENFENLNHLSNLKKIIKEQIIKVEKKSNQFINDVNVILNLNRSIELNLSVYEYKNNLPVENKDLEFLIKVAKQQILKNYKNYKILHLIINKILINKKEVSTLQDSIKCKHFSVELKFICYDNNELISFKNLFAENNISIAKFICANYLVSEKNKIGSKNIHLLAMKKIAISDEKEVRIITKKYEKSGFFERLFNFFK